MSKFIRSLIVMVGAIWAVTSLTQIAAPTFAQNDSRRQALPPTVLGEEEAYREDAKAYVAAFGGTIDEAVRLLKLQ